MKQTYFLLFFLLTISFSNAQKSADPDPNFDSRDFLPKLTLFTREFAAQPDGKIVVVGNSCSYKLYNDKLVTPRANIVRLNKDLSLDETFNIGTGFDTPPHNLAIQSDGKILVCGGFSKYNNTTVGKVIRLNSDGSIDKTFSFSGATNIKVVKILANGKILIGGNIGLKNIARLNSNGSFDTTFNQVDPSSLLYKFEIQSDGKIVRVCASGSSYSINRINADGSTDKTFKTIDQFQSICVANTVGYNTMDDCKLAIQSDDKILFGGCFNQFNTSDISGFIRFNTDGTIDKSFKYVYPGTPRATVKDFILLPNDKILTYDLISINTDGSYDPTKVAKLDINTMGSKILLLPNNELLICSNNETKLEGTILSYHKFIKVDLTTSKINYLQQPSTYFAGNDVLEKPNNDIVVLGYSNTLHNTKYHDGIKLLNKNGGFIRNDNLYKDVFLTTPSEKNYFKRGVVQPDGKIILFKIQTNGLGGLIRYNNDFSVDNSFTPLPYLGYINSLTLQNDGKLLVIADNTEKVLRLNNDGTRDVTFAKNGEFDKSCYTGITQADGKIIVAGNFTSYNGIKVNRLARFNSDGTLDTTFHADEKLDGFITALGLQSDGKIIIGGLLNFDAITDKSSVLQRLNSNGSIDQSFVKFNATIAGHFVKSLVVQPDNKIVFFTNLNSTTNFSTNDFKRLQANGEIDNTFDSGTGFDGNINMIRFQKDGSLLVTGSFTKYRDNWTNGTIRLLGNKSTLATPDFDLNENNNSPFALYPNPVKDILNISSEENADISSVEVFNILGQSVLNFKNQKTFSAVNVSELKQGIYFLQIKSSKGTITKKIIKN